MKIDWQEPGSLYKQDRESKIVHTAETHKSLVCVSQILFIESSISLHTMNDWSSSYRNYAQRWEPDNKSIVTLFKSGDVDLLIETSISSV